jgi:ribonucleotide monophosphatase NagD (HAD superfamily)
MRDLLLRCAAVTKRTNRPIPMIVANPDLVTVDGKELRTMPGTLAKWYQAAGGEVHLMGKPAHIIYDAAFAELGHQINRSQVLAIGDSLEHDIMGARMAGIDAVFVAGGIHAVEFGLEGSTSTPNDWEWNANKDDKLFDLCTCLKLSNENESLTFPNYVVPFFGT